MASALIQKMLDPAKTMKSKQARRRRVLADTLDKDWLPLPPVTLDVEENKNRHYTADENYRAYRLFAIMDIDNSGSVSLRELSRILMGDVYRTNIVSFNHPDTGIIWELDHEDCVIVGEMDPDSPSAQEMQLCKYLRLASFNNVPIPPNDKSSLEKTYQAILLAGNGPVSFETVEPIVILSPFSCVLDVEIDSVEYSVTLPSGAAYSADVFESRMQEVLRESSHLKHIKLRFDPANRQVRLTCKKFPFRLLFGTGSNTHLSCRYAFGFTSEDSELGHDHYGRPMLMDLNLGISDAEMEILLTELMEKYDTDGSGEFEFEEFRDFFVKLLDTDESRDLLRRFAEYRFRDQEKEAWWKAKMEEQRLKSKRRKALRLKNKSIVEKQKATFLANSVVGEDDVRRRIRNKVQEQELRKAKMEKMKNGYARFEEERRRKKAEAEAERLKQADEEARAKFEDSRPRVGLSKERRVAIRVTRKKNKDRYLLHKERRAAVLEKIIQENAKLKLAVRRDLRNVVEKDQQSFISLDLKEAIREGITRALKIGGRDIHNRTDYSLDLSSTIASPALQVSSAVFGAAGVGPNDVDLIDMPSSHLHPACWRYFLIKEPKKRSAEFDSTKKHPAFFTAEYDRKTNRHSSLGLSCSQVITKDREEGALYRMLRGIERCTAIPPEDELPSRKKKVKFVDKDDNIRRKDGPLARFTIVSVSLLDLPKLGWSPNSPFATLTCGDWKASTEINSLAGSHSDWTELGSGWTFPVFKGQKLTVAAYTGTVVIHLNFGQFSWDVDDLIRRPLTHGSHLDIVGTFGEEENNFGHLRVRVFVELGQEFDWYVAAYKRKMEEERRFAKLRRKILQGQRAEPPVEIHFPVQFVIDSISLVDLRAVHLFFNNSPRVEVECGSFLEMAMEQQQAGSSAHWNALGWTVNLVSERANMIFMVNSGSVNIGRFALNGMDMARLPRDKHGAIEILGVLTAHGSDSGKIRVHAKFRLPRVQRKSVTSSNETASVSTASGVVTKESDLTTQALNSTPKWLPPAPQTFGSDDLKTLLSHSKGSSRQEGTLVQSAMPASSSSNANPIFKPPLHLMSPGSPSRPSTSGGRVDMAWTVRGGDVGASPSKGSADGVDVVAAASGAESGDAKIFPARVVLRGIECQQLASVHKVKPNSPMVKINCGPWESTTDIIYGAGATARWNNLEWQFPMIERLAIEINAFSEGSKKHVHIGFAVSTARELSTLPQNRRGERILKLQLSNGADVTGAITLRLVLVPERESSLQFYFPELMKAIKLGPKDDLLSSYGASATLDTSSQAEKKMEYKPDKLLYSNTSVIREPPRTFPFRMNVSVVTVADLRSVHVVTANSPCVSIACGSWGASTEAIVGAGKNAQWEGLKWSFFVHEGDAVRIGARSRNRLIGEADISALELLAAVTDEHGHSDVFLNIKDAPSPQITGKIKIVFSKEAFYEDDIEEEASLPPIVIEAPFLATVYTVAISELRKAHPFGKNQPMVKAACGRWRGITSARGGDTSETGSEAKWDDVMWSVFMDKDFELRLTVTSGSVVLGFIVLSPEDLSGKPIDKLGLTNFEGFIHDGRRTEPVGRIRLICRLEAHIDSDRSEADSDDDQMFEFESRDSVLGLPKRVIPRVSVVSIISIGLVGLPPMHKVKPNSPHVTLTCGDWVERTQVLHYKGASALWDGLNWACDARRQSCLTLEVGSDDLVIGSCTFRTRDLYQIDKDDHGHSYISRKVMTAHGEERGVVRVKFLVDEKPTDEDKMIFGDFEEGVLGNPCDDTTTLTMPVNLSITKISLTGLTPLSTRKPDDYPRTLTFSIGEKWSMQTSTTGIDVSHAMWDDLSWNVTVTDDFRGTSHSNHIFQSQKQKQTQFGLCIFMKCGNYDVGEAMLPMDEILALPRTRSGDVTLRAAVRQGQKLRGRLLISINIRQHIEDIAPSCLEVDAGEEAIVEVVDTRPRLMARLNVIAINVSNMTQIYGIFKNSPRVTISNAMVEKTTSVKASAGENAAWGDLEWEPFALFRDGSLSVKIMSNNESIGGSSVSAMDILELPISNNGTIVISRAIEDGSVRKGELSMFCELEVLDDVEDQVEAARELFAAMGSTRGGKEAVHDSDDDDDESTSSEPLTAAPAAGSPAFLSGLVPIPGNTLSQSTPTPVFTRVCIHEVEMWDLKSVHTIQNNSPVLAVHCGEWRDATEPQSHAGGSATWTNLSLTFAMRRMTFVKLSVISCDIIIGTVVVSTREILAADRDREGVSTLTRDIEDDTEVTGKLRIYFRFDTHGEDIPLLADNNEILASNVAPIQGEPKVIKTNKLAQADLPIKLTIESICLVDLTAVHNVGPNSPFVVTTCGDWKSRTDVKKRSGSNAKWMNLTMICTMFDNSCVLEFRIRSATLVIGTFSITPYDLVRIPRDERGMTEINASIMKDGFVQGRIQSWVELRVRSAGSGWKPIDFQEPPPSAPSTPRMVAYLRISQVTISGLSFSVKRVFFTITVGAWGEKTEFAKAIAGMSVMGNFSWGDISIPNNALLEMKIFSDEPDILDPRDGVFKEIGVMGLNSTEFLQLRRDKAGNVTVIGDVYYKNAVQCKVSMGIRVVDIPDPELLRLEAEKRAKDEAEHEKYRSLRLSVMNSEYSFDSHGNPIIPFQLYILSIHITNMKNVKNLGKSVPSIRFECTGWKASKKAAQYDSSSATWPEMFWSFTTRPRWAVRLLVQSGANLVGSSVTASQAFFERYESSTDDNDEELFLDVDLVKHGVVNGIARVAFRVGNVVAPTAAISREGEMGADTSRESLGSLDTMETLLTEDARALREDEERLMGGPASPTSSHPGFSHSKSSAESVFSSSASDPSSVLRPKTSRGPAHEDASVLSHPTSNGREDYEDETISDGDDVSLRSNLKEGSSVVGRRDGSKSESESESDEDSPHRALLAALHGPVGKHEEKIKTKETLSSRPSTGRSRVSSDSAASRKSRCASEAGIEVSEHDSPSSSSSSDERSGSDDSDESDDDTDSNSYPDTTTGTKFKNVQLRMLTAQLLSIKLEYLSLSDISRQLKEIHNIPTLFQIDKLSWLACDAPEEAVANEVAQSAVSSLIDQVVKSFVAMESGRDFFQGSPRYSDDDSDRNSDDDSDEIATRRSSRDRYETPNSPSGPSGHYSLHHFSKEYVKKFILVAGSSCINRRLHKSKRSKAAKEPMASKSELLRVATPAFRKREGVVMTALGGMGFDVPIDTTFEKDEPDDGTNGIAAIVEEAKKVRISFKDMTGFDFSFIDKRVFPMKPYLTVAKALGGWSAKTRLLWTGERYLTKKDKCIYLLDLEESEGFQKCILRIGQHFIFDLHDAGSGLIIAKAKLTFEEIMSCQKDENDMIGAVLKFEIANEYGGGESTGVLTLHLDLTVNVFVRQPKPPEYWDKHRIQHWKTYPLTPIATGVVRHRYLDVATEYDRQEIIHPAFFGFSVRWKGFRVDESRFIHPMFQGYNLAKKPLNKAAKAALEKKIQQDRDPNPWKWDPKAAEMGQCPVCSDGLAGCPRCYMLPPLANGDPSNPADFQFDPDRERAEEMAKEHKAIEAAAKAAKEALAAKIAEKQMGSLAQHLKQLAKAHNDSSSDDDDPDESTKEKKTDAELLQLMEEEEAELPRVEIHTKLTTYLGLRLHRKKVLNLFTVYIKSLPSGGIRKLHLDATDTVFNLYNMYTSHVDTGNADSRMLVLPTSKGLFEITNVITVGSDVMIADTQGRDILRRYGMSAPNSTIVLLYFPGYMRRFSAHLLQAFAEKNSEQTIELLPTFDTCDRIPRDVSEDPLQKFLLKPILRLFTLQQYDFKRMYQQMGNDFRNNQATVADELTKRKKAQTQAEEQLRRAAERRVESQIKSLPVEQRDAARRILMNRELEKRGFTSEIERFKIIKRADDARARKKKLEQKMKKQASSQSSVVSASDVLLGGSDGDGGEDDLTGGSDIDSGVDIDVDSRSLFDPDEDYVFDGYDSERTNSVDSYASDTSYDDDDDDDDDDGDETVSMSASMSSMGRMESKEAFVENSRDTEPSTTASLTSRHVRSDGNQASRNGRKDNVGERLADMIPTASRQLRPRSSNSDLSFDSSRSSIPDDDETTLYSNDVSLGRAVGYVIGESKSSSSSQIQGSSSWANSASRQSSISTTTAAVSFLQEGLTERLRSHDLQSQSQSRSLRSLDSLSTYSSRSGYSDDSYADGSFQTRQTPLSSRSFEGSSSDVRGNGSWSSRGTEGQSRTANQNGGRSARIRSDERQRAGGLAPISKSLAPTSTNSSRSESSSWSARSGSLLSSSVSTGLIRDVPDDDPSVLKLTDRSDFNSLDSMASAGVSLGGDVSVEDIRGQQRLPSQRKEVTGVIPWESITLRRGDGATERFKSYTVDGYSVGTNSLTSARSAASDYTLSSRHSEGNNSHISRTSEGYDDDSRNQSSLYTPYGSNSSFGSEQMFSNTSQGDSLSPSQTPLSLSSRSACSLGTSVTSRQDSTARWSRDGGISFETLPHSGHSVATGEDSFTHRSSSPSRQGIDSQSYVTELDLSLASEHSKSTNQSRPNSRSNSRRSSRAAHADNGNGPVRDASVGSGGSLSSRMHSAMNSGRSEATVAAVNADNHSHFRRENPVRRSRK